MAMDSIYSVNRMTQFAHKYLSEIRREAEKGADLSKHGDDASTAN